MGRRAEVRESGGRKGSSILGAGCDAGKKETGLFTSWLLDGC
jgi:hypothetical protein